MSESENFAQELSLLKKTLTLRCRQRRKWAEQEHLYNYRLFNFDHNLPVAIDIYARKYLHVIVHETRYMPQPQEIIDTVHQASGVQKDFIFLKIRSKKYQEDFPEKSREPAVFWINEDDVQLKINLSSYIDTGLFLDHRIARRTIRTHSLDRNVLNLFCYTGAFSLFAAMGAARSVHSMDISQTYLVWAQENFRQNHLEGPQYKFTCQNVLDYLNQDVEELYDIIILDPPVFSNSRKMTQTLNIERDYPFLINACLKRINKGGFLFFSSPLSRLNLKSEKIFGHTEEITKNTVSLDFKGSLPHRSWIIYPENTRKNTSHRGKRKP